MRCLVSHLKWRENRDMKSPHNGMALSIGPARGAGAWERLCRPVRISLTAACIVLFSFTHGPYAKEMRNEKSIAGLEKSLSLLKSGQCQKAWNELWDLVDSGDRLALFWLATSSVVHPFAFPGISDAVMGEIFLPMALYATLTLGTDDMSFTVTDVRTVVVPAAINVFGSDIDQTNSAIILKCFQSKERADTCVNLAIKIHFIPSYDDYIKAVKKINADGLEVSCTSSSNTDQH
jgi:hypothetical protein